MKTKALISVICSLMLAIGISTNSFAQKGADTVVMKANVTCDGCKSKIEKNLGYEKGVSFVNADVATKTVTIVYKIDKTNPDALSSALTKMGYSNTIVGANDSTIACQKTGKACCKTAKPCCKKPENCKDKTQKAE